ncbi:hypothetical protein L2E82_10293 [Cichorium intybus]|uniref:Uncharacterized protein n=1 Tax=Cichorium intybus TaxID=13427 RepID=A0ACB9GB71_CICIN|nr:hypothetical protein L2E82_10293 [Cichorium intybus]
MMAEVATVSKMNVHVFTLKLHNRSMFDGNLIEYAEIAQSFHNRITLIVCSYSTLVEIAQRLINEEGQSFGVMLKAGLRMVWPSQVFFEMYQRDSSRFKYHSLAFEMLLSRIGDGLINDSMDIFWFCSGILSNSFRALKASSFLAYPMVSVVHRMIYLMRISSSIVPALHHSADNLRPLVHESFPELEEAQCVISICLTDWLPAMKAAAGVSNQSGKPWILDPPGVGASSFRLKACLELIELKPIVIRGNGSEIIALSMASIGSTKGADSLHESSDAVESMKSLAKSTNSIVAISGLVDFVTDGQRVVGAHNGVPLMQKIIASGCVVTALIAAFVAIDPEIVKST